MLCQLSNLADIQAIRPPTLLSSLIIVRGKVIEPFLKDRESGEAESLHTRAQAVRAGNQKTKLGKPLTIDACGTGDEAAIGRGRRFTKLIGGIEQAHGRPLCPALVVQAGESSRVQVRLRDAHGSARVEDEAAAAPTSDALHVASRTRLADYLRARVRTLIIGTSEKPEGRPIKSSEHPGLLWTTLLVHGR
jgi:hypothetical protein